MDKMKGLAKGGWHPAGDKSITRDNWKSDLRGIATGKKKDPYEEQRNHQSAPLATLKDPDSFGPPPRHYAANGIERAGTASSGGSSLAAPPDRLTGGLGSNAVETGYAQRKREQEEAQRLQAEQEAKAASAAAGPYRTDTTGLRTDNLPKPPVRRDSPARSQSPALPPRVPPRQNAAPPPPPRQVAPPPSLPPRQNEYPDEHTPAPPPPYNEALQAEQPKTSWQDRAQSRVQSQVQSQVQNHVQSQVQNHVQNQVQGHVNQAAANRLGQAGVSVPAFGIGGNSGSSSNVSHNQSPVNAAPGGQLSELQQRFAKMNTSGGSENSPSSPAAGGGLAAIAQKKAAPPPPPPKKPALGDSSNQQSPSMNRDSPAPPPIPMSSKPKP